MFSKTEAPGARNYLVVCELKLRPSPPFEGALASFGKTYRVNHTTWLLRAEATIASLRNTLMQHLGASDPLLIVDVGEGRKAFCNLGPEAEAQVRLVWQKPQAAAAV